MLPADSLAIVHVQSEGEGETPPATWVTGHQQCPHIRGAEGVLSKNQA